MKMESGGQTPYTGAEEAEGGRVMEAPAGVQWVLQPRGTARVRGPQHFRHSVREGVRLAQYEHVLGADAQALRNLFPTGVARLWGSTPPVREKSEKVTALEGRRAGDEVLFYAAKKFVAKARILGLFHNQPLAKAVWGVDDKEKTWEHIMALGDIVELDVPAEPILRGLDVPVPLRSLTLVGAEGRRRFLGMVDASAPSGGGFPRPGIAFPRQGAKLGRDDVFRALSGLRTHMRGHRPSRHKPITLLWAIGRLAAERDRMVGWETFRDEVGPLLKDFGLPDSNVTPEYPFCRLRSSGLWDVEGIEGPDATPSQLTAVRAAAGFNSDAAKVLRRSLARADAIGLLCSTYLGDVDREELLERVGLAGYATASGKLPDSGGGNDPVPRRSVTSSRPDRDQQLVEDIKVMYGHECQVCGARVETRYSHYSEAAHIRGIGGPHNGPDELSNLLCLCPNHHVEFDRLAIYIDEDWAVRRNSTGDFAYQLKRQADHEIKPEHLRYHRGLCGRI
ncbi:HNH endonuclease [Streptomyces sp. NBC_01463]|uniref:HNH endonuclease n=1 Tax=unclassified Streptomyces TaxID=2593676 RepID=UPI00255424A3|nr:HNH endonuclease [Streptomyces sp. RTGN2]